MVDDAHTRIWFHDHLLPRTDATITTPSRACISTIARGLTDFTITIRIVVKETHDEKEGVA